MHTFCEFINILWAGWEALEGQMCPTGCQLMITAVGGSYWRVCSGKCTNTFSYLCNGPKCTKCRLICRKKRFWVDVFTVPLPQHWKPTTYKGMQAKTRCKGEKSRFCLIHRIRHRWKDKDKYVIYMLTCNVLCKMILSCLFKSVMLPEG